MASGIVTALQMPCLGRPFNLGMLYDCRDDRLIPGVTLWNHSTLQRALDSRLQESLQFSVVTEDSIENKASSLGVDASLKLSLLGGLVNVSGSAKFLNDQRQSKQQARVSLQYSMKSRFEQLTMQHLAVDKFEYPDVFDKKEATHVVTAILYGAEAFFVFDCEVSKQEKYQDIHGRMAVMIKKIPSVTISGDGKLDMKDNEISEVSRFQCQYHGDILISENPTNFQEAVRIYKELPQKMQGDGKSATKVVPKRVWLYPLCKLDSRAAQLVREISTSLVTQAQKLVENLQEAKVRATDLKKSEVCSNFHGIGEQLSRFTEMITEYEMDIVKKLSMILPSIRGGGAEENELENVFQQNSASPFSYQSLSSWLQSKEQEEKMLQSYLTGMQSEKIRFAFVQGELDAIIANVDIDYILCFAFQVPQDHSFFLESLFKYLRTGDISTEYRQIASKQWFQNRKIAGDIKTKMRAFKSFAEANARSENTRYVVAYIRKEYDDSTDKGADILLYSDGQEEIYSPPSKPGKPESTNTTHDTIELKWSEPQNGPQNVQSYTVMYQQSGSSEWKKEMTNTNSATLKSLKPATAYQVKVFGQCEIGVTQDSLISESIETKNNPEDRLAFLFKTNSRHLGAEKGGHEIYKIPVCSMPSRTMGVAKCTVGNPKYLTLEHPEKVLMLVGATGSGKSTLINGIANYVLGVHWEDDFRFKLITKEASNDQTKSVTQTITSYSFPKFDGSPLEFRLTVVDTPGFGDTGGLERDEQITALIKDFFSTRGPEGIDHIDGIGFVSQSPLVRLTHTQKYIIDSILSIFGVDIADNIFLMTTFADGAYSPVVDAIKKHIEDSNPPIPINVQTLLHFKFNNSALFTKPQSTSKTTFDEMYWIVGCKSLDDFFQHLLVTKQQTLQLTRKVLDEREKLQTLIQGVLQDVHNGVNAVNEMRDEKQALEANEAKIRANKDFTYTTTEYHQKKDPLPVGKYVTNCVKCNRTCHYPCAIPNDSDKRHCAAMDSRGNCEVCPGHCYWDPHHVNNQFKWEEEQKTVTKHYTDLEKKYKDAKQGKATAQSMILQIRTRVTKTFEKICKDIHKAKNCLERLEEIALKPNPLTEVQYIDLLIRSETDEAKAGWEKRVHCLENARKMAEIMDDVRKGEIAKHMNLEAMMDDLLKDVPIKEERPKQSLLKMIKFW